MDQLRPLFAITSIVNLRHQSVYSPTQRYEQTIKTIECIKDRVPNAKIVVIESSLGDKIVFDNVTMYYVKDPSHILNQHKSIGESLILEDFLRSDLFKLISKDCNVFFKISGRYLLTEAFDITRFHINKPTFRRVYYNHSCNPDKSVVVTSLFSFPIYLIDFLIERLALVRHRITYERCNDIEQSIIYGVPDDRVNYVDVIGIGGHIAPSGQWQAY